MKNRLLLMIGLWLGCMLTACEEEIKVPNNQITVEQFTPIQKGNKYVFSGRVNFPKGLDHEVVKVGFWISGRSEYDNGNYENAIDAFTDLPYYPDELYYYYERWLTGETEDFWGDSHPDYWVEEIASDGSFTLELNLEPKQYMCKAFAMNIVVGGEYDSYYNKIQIAQSKPFYFSGNVSGVSLQLDNMLDNSFLVTVMDESNVQEVGICWSETETIPDVEDNPERGYIHESESSISLPFNEEDVVYLRAYALYHIQDAYSSEGESYRIVYSDVLEYHPKEQVFEVNSPVDMKKLIQYNSSAFRGKIIFNYAPNLSDWDYSDFYTVNCSIIGKGVVKVHEISSSGYLEGVTLSSDIGTQNYGILKNINGSLYANYGQIIDSDSIEVENNIGTIQNCKRVSINHNYGLIQNCRDNLSIEQIYDDGNFETGTFTNYTGYWSGDNMKISAENEGYNSKYCLGYSNYGTSRCRYDFFAPLPAGTYTLSFAAKSESWAGEFIIYLDNIIQAITSLSSSWHLYSMKVESPFDFYSIRFTSSEYTGNIKLDFWIDDVQLDDALKRYSSTYMVETNETSGQIIDCSIEDSGGKYICNTNNGLIKDCTPTERVCATNYGIIQDSSK